MNTRIRKRGNRYEVLLDLGEQDAQRCPSCRKRYWLEAGRLDACPKCGGELEDVSARRERWVGAYRLQKEAKAAATAAVSAIQNGELVGASRLTLGQYLAEWLDGLEQRVADGNMKPSTALSYRGHVEKHIVPALGYLRLQALTPRHVDMFHAELAKKPGRGGESLSVTTRRHVHVTLHAVLRDAKRKRLIGFNPADDADVPRTERAKVDAGKLWSGEELRTFLRATAEDRLGVLWQVMAETGLRRAEAVGLRWQDVDLKAAVLRVESTRTSVGYRVYEGSPKSRAGRRQLPLLPETVAALKAWQRQQKLERLQWGKGWTDTGLVFTREDGTAWHPDRVSKLFQRAVKAAKVPRIRLHDVRHCFATQHIAAGTQAKHLQNLMGHSRIGVTLDTYVHPDHEDLATAQAAFGARLRGHA